MDEPTTHERIPQRLQDVFRRCFFDEGITLHEQMTTEDIDGWDSLSHVRLLLMIEDSFGIKLSGSEGTRLKNVGELIDLISRRRFGSNA